MQVEANTPESSRKIRLVMELRRSGISDTQVLSAIERVPRERFVPDFFQDRAYEDNALPISCGQTISQPYVVAFMTSALKLRKRMTVLEIGTGSGYQAAVLSKLCRRVYSMERHKSLLRHAEHVFEELVITNITTRVGDGYKGWPETAPFDRIIVTAAAPNIPTELTEQLADGGILVIPIGGADQQDVIRVTRDGDGFEYESLLAVRFVPMVKGIGKD